MNDAVTKYLQSDVYTPFFLVVGDDDYITTKEDLSALGLDAFGVSNYCVDDRIPNIDNLFADLKGGKPKVLVGLGEYLALCGEATAFDNLARLQDFSLDGSKVVLVLRGVEGTVRKLQSNDLRFDKRRVACTPNCGVSISVTCVPQSFDLPSAVDGLSEILAVLEKGAVRVVAKTERTFDESLFDVRIARTAYDGIKHWLPNFALSNEHGNEEEWSELMSALNATNGSIDKVFGNYSFSENLLDDFDRMIQGATFESWLFFIALKLKVNELPNSYLVYALEKTKRLEELKGNVLSSIIDISHNDEHFKRFFRERRELVAKFSEADIASFVNYNRADLEKSLYWLTSQTKTEREEFIRLFSSLDKKKVLGRSKDVYPQLHDYLCLYAFSDQNVDRELQRLFTNYFDRYKWQKVLNSIDDDFVELVEGLALSSERKYNLLRSRNDIIGGIDKTRTKLYWLDALGVEYLGFIQALCKNMGLALKIHIGRCELPTITSLNKDFYVSWLGDKEPPDKRLDEIKHHGDDGGYNYEKNGKLPIHLASELNIIQTVIEKIAIDLAKHTYDKILLVSDHGASRLAVIKEQEEKYEADTSGEHSGRCCKAFPDYDLPFATEENGYLVLANYGRFKGSRKTNVEVHGGASLEEVLVPVIELTCAKPNIKVQLVNDVVYADYKTCAQLEIFSNTKLDNPRIVIDGRPCQAIQKGDNHYTATTDIKRAGTYQADIFDDDSLVGTASFTVQGKNRSNEDFDF